MLGAPGQDQTSSPGRTSSRRAPLCPAASFPALRGHLQLGSRSVAGVLFPPLAKLPPGAAAFHMPFFQTHQGGTCSLQKTKLPRKYLVHSLSTEEDLFHGVWLSRACAWTNAPSCVLISGSRLLSLPPPLGEWPTRTQIPETRQPAPGPSPCSPCSPSQCFPPRLLLVLPPPWPLPVLPLQSFPVSPPLHGGPSQCPLPHGPSSCSPCSPSQCSPQGSSQCSLLVLLLVLPLRRL